MDIKFKNTDIYPNVDWEKEIANEGELERDEHARRSSDSLFVMLQIKDSIDREIENIGVDGIEEHKKANMLRMVEYFYCKFVYHHAMFYRKKELLDLLKTQKQYRRFDHPVLSIKKKFGKTIESTVPVEDIQKLGEVIAESIREKRKKKEPADGGFEEAKEMFEKEGLIVEKPIGIGKENDRDTVCVIHDGIRYHLYLMKSSSMSGVRTQEGAHKEANDYKSLIKKYHPLIKRIHDQMKSEIPGMENIWVMEGGGMQHQAFFGNENGYIAILCLGMKKSKKTDYGSLIFQSYEDDDKWQTYKNFKVDGVECIAFGDKNPYKNDTF